MRSPNLQITRKKPKQKPGVCDTVGIDMEFPGTILKKELQDFSGLDFWLLMSYSRKKPNRARGWWAWGNGISKQLGEGILGKNPNRKDSGWGYGISWGQRNSMWNFQGSLFLVLKFPRDLTQFCGIFRGWALLCLDFPGVAKVKKNEKFQGVGGFKKVYLQPSPLQD